MALAAQAAAAAASKQHAAPLTPASAASPHAHTTHDYTPGSFAGSASMSRELPTPEALTNRRAELDGSQPISSGEYSLSCKDQPSAVQHNMSSAESSTLAMK